jgi:Pentapeptide repeats (8 copies)
MAQADYLEFLRQGVDVWNTWMADHELSFGTGEPDLRRAKLRGAKLSGAVLRRAGLTEADLGGADLSRADLNEALLSEADLGGADLRGANLSDAYLPLAMFNGANLSGADLRGADLTLTTFVEANLSGADLRGANLRGANLRGANLRGANLRGASLRGAMLANANITDADLTGCSVYGASVWGVKLSENTRQQNLIITDSGETEITIDNIEIAQFIYLLLNNAKIRHVIDTITSKAVLILGRFTDERKAILESLRDKLRERDYLPILFDFDKPISRTTDETITLLARMARFVIADISDAKSVLQELRAIVPELPSVPVQPVIIATQGEPGMFDFYRGYSSFLQVHRYNTPAQLLADLSDRVIGPAEAKAVELQTR